MSSIQAIYTIKILSNFVKITLKIFLCSLRKEKNKKSLFEKSHLKPLSQNNEIYARELFV